MLVGRWGGGGWRVVLGRLRDTHGKTATHREGHLHDQNVIQLTQFLLLV
jgi:hypothetical protein